MPQFEGPWAKKGKYEYCYQISSSVFRSVRPMNRLLGSESSDRHPKITLATLPRPVLSLILLLLK